MKQLIAGASTPGPTRVLNAMTVDVEDYFQVSAFEKYIPRDEWDRIPSRVERNVDAVLQLFDRHRVRATFFMLGWIAERYPKMVREIAAQGHEIASHGYSHVRTTRQTPEEFRLDVGRTKMLLEDVVGCPVNGFRAASFSIGEHNLWALRVLADVGYLYSSSIYPVRHDHYGMPTAPRFAFRQDPSSVLEIPITTIELLKRTLPSGGGGYFRLFPYALSRWALKRVNELDRQPAVFFFHPWEIDPEQPRQRAADLRTRFRHYVNLSRMECRLDRLLADFHWDCMTKVFLQTETNENREPTVADRRSA